MVGDLVVDVELHRRLGITVLSEADVKNRKVLEGPVEWPQERPFNPPGITLDEARYAMEKYG